MISWDKYNEELYKLEQIIFEYDLMSDSERTKVKSDIRKNRKKREEESEIMRETVYIGEKIYNEVKEFLKNQKSCTGHLLMKQFKIGTNTAEYILNKLQKENIVEEKFGTYWVIANEI